MKKSMKEQELRLGNLVIRMDAMNLPFTMPVCRIDGDGFVALSAGSHSVSCTMKELSPIPITPEWLERAGFTEQANAWNGPNKEFDFGLFAYEGDPYTYNSCECNPKVEYVHQLQNLYFVLTGEELTFTDPTTKKR